jgi:hypothetical protein
MHQARSACNDLTAETQRSLQRNPWAFRRPRWAFAELPYPADPIWSIHSDTVLYLMAHLIPTHHGHIGCRRISRLHDYERQQLVRRRLRPRWGLEGQPGQFLWEK